MRGMTMRFPYGVCKAGVVLALLCFVCMPAYGQNSPGQGAKKPLKIAGDFEKVHLLPPGGPTPRMPDEIGRASCRERV
jgi:hypothetical protein